MSPPKKRDISRSEDTRRRIIEAAFEVFAERGYDGALTREIAKRAGVNHPLIIYHFKSKFGLWKECAAVGQHDFAAMFRRLLQENMDRDVAGRLSALVETVIASSAARQSEHRFLIRYLLDCPHVEPSGAHDALKGNDVWIGEVIAAQAAGVLPKGFEPLLLQYLIVGMATRMFLDPEGFRVRTGRRIDDPDVIAEQTRLVLAFLLPATHPAHAARKRTPRTHRKASKRTG
ncbi:MAG: TetR/AcrR family transcriptional regulator [Gammaproteobacteria bacterium]